LRESIPGLIINLIDNASHYDGGDDLAMNSADLGGAEAAPALTLADLRPGQSAQVVRVPEGAIGRNLASLGLVRGAEVALDRRAPLGDPRIYSVLGYRLSLRETEARQVSVEVV
jgi:ferrous iron transport protein A